MQQIDPSSRPFASCKRQALVLLLSTGFALGCSDNATKLSYAIERSFAAGAFVNGHSAHELLYVPRSNPQLPYYLIFFPEHPVEQTELEAAGLPETLAARVYSGMAYLSVGNAPHLVVVQDGGDLNFTTHWHRFASVPEVLVIRGEGTVAITLRPGEHGVVVEKAR